jgi:hypothetical protein
VTWCLVRHRDNFDLTLWRMEMVEGSVQWRALLLSMLSLSYIVI